MGWGWWALSQYRSWCFSSNSSSYSEKNVYINDNGVKKAGSARCSWRKLSFLSLRLARAGSPEGPCPGSGILMRFACVDKPGHSRGAGGARSGQKCGNESMGGLRIPRTCEDANSESVLPTCPGGGGRARGGAREAAGELFGGALSE